VAYFSTGFLPVHVIRTPANYTHKIQANISRKLYKLIVHNIKIELTEVRDVNENRTESTLDGWMDGRTDRQTDTDTDTDRQSVSQSVSRSVS